jgi:hypothetical protein
MDGERTPDSFGYRALKVLIWVVVIVGGIYLLTILFDGINHRIEAGSAWDGYIAIVVISLIVLGVTALATWDSGPYRGHDWTAVGALALVVGLFAVGTLWAAHKHADRNDQVVEWYCGYGSVSARQLRGCVDHMNAAAVYDLDTPAAEFARGQGGCGDPGSGPYCKQAQAARDRNSGY